MNNFINNYKTQGGELKNVTETDLKSCDYVFSFYESVIKASTVSGVRYVTFDIIVDTVILRIKFLSEGQVYNLGVVSNKTSSTGESAGNASTDLNDVIEDAKKSINEMLEQFGQVIALVISILGIVIIIILGLSFLGILGPVLKFIIKIITWPFKTLKKQLTKRNNRFL